MNRSIIRIKIEVSVVLVRKDEIRDWWKHYFYKFLNENMTGESDLEREFCFEHMQGFCEKFREISRLEDNEALKKMERGKSLVLDRWGYPISFKKKKNYVAFV